MNSTRYILKLGFIAIISSLLFQNQLIQSQTIHLEGDVWAPYVMDPSSGKNGFIVDIAKTVFERAGYSFHFKVVPWTRTLIDVENGSADGAIGIYFTQAYEKKFIVPDEEIGLSINKLFVLAGNTWTYKNQHSLDTMVLGTITDYDYGELNEYISSLHRSHSPFLQVQSGNEALEKNIKKLVNGRISVLIEDDLVLNYFARVLKVEKNIVEAGIAKPFNKVGIAFSTKNAKSVEYAKILSTGIQNIRKTGELKIILDKYHVKDWKK